MKRKNPSKSAAPKRAATPELEQIEQILRTMSEHNLEEFEYSRGDLRIRVKKPLQGMVPAAPRALAAPEIIVAAPLFSAPAAIGPPQRPPPGETPFFQFLTLGAISCCPLPGGLHSS